MVRKYTQCLECFAALLCVVLGKEARLFLIIQLLLLRPIVCFVQLPSPLLLPSPVAKTSSLSHTTSTGLAPTRAEELLTSQLWPLDMLTVDDLCWCRCYVKSAPLRPHSAGAHLDCTQAGKTHRAALYHHRHTHAVKPLHHRDLMQLLETFLRREFKSNFVFLSFSFLW